MYNGCPGCPYKHYSRFYDYYGDFDYADKWVSAALAGTSMTFTSGQHGPNDFSALGNDARKEAAKKGSAYMNVWMYVIREFEDAIDDCSSCVGECNEFSLNSGSVHAWDEGVAFYSGSLEGTTSDGNSAGKMVYRLAEKRCANFGTCGMFGNETSGKSQVNYDLFPLFAEGARLLQRGECTSVRPVVDSIVSLMTVPLVQGSLRYACASLCHHSPPAPCACLHGSHHHACHTIHQLQQCDALLTATVCGAGTRLGTMTAGHRRMLQRAPPSRLQCCRSCRGATRRPHRRSAAS